MTDGIGRRRFALWDGDTWWAARKVRPGRPIPEDFRPIAHDPATGVTTGWERAHRVDWWPDLTAAATGAKPYRRGRYELVQSEGIHRLRPIKSLPLPCPFLVRGGLCRKRHGHRCRHQPGEFTTGSTWIITDRKARSICDRIRSTHTGQRLVWPMTKPRCPHCRAVVKTFQVGVPSDPIWTADTRQAIREHDLLFGPCGHSFRWISERARREIVAKR
jgi:hypothetical protein